METNKDGTANQHVDKLDRQGVHVHSMAST